MRHLDKFKQHHPATYGIRDSWIPIVDNTLDKCFEIIPEMQILQIKEKFGQLRLYTTHDSDRRIRPTIMQAERKCAAPP